ncbi:methylated-DNA--[protein]-cysteine S-methyltransferase [Streptacidiphilus sp. PAMC 29251]
MDSRHALVDTVLGAVTVVASDQAVVGLYFSHHWYLPPADSIGPRVEVQGDALLEAVRTQLTEYLAGDRTAFDLPTATQGNPLQERVWAMLREIPYGETTTYGELAERLGDKALAQAVGQANGHNPISIIVPCHRVVGKNGKLTGYAGGLERKQFLLELEEPESARAAKLF